MSARGARQGGAPQAAPLRTGLEVRLDGDQACRVLDSEAGFTLAGLDRRTTLRDRAGQDAGRGGADRTKDAEGGVGIWEAWGFGMDVRVERAPLDQASGLQTDRFEAGLEVAVLLQIRGALGTGPDIADGDVLHLGPPVLAVLSSTGGVPWVWKDSIVLRPQAWPFLRSSSVQVIGFQSGARISRAPALATST